MKMMILLMLEKKDMKESMIDQSLMDLTIKYGER
jgi:hypothetical protein